MSVYETLGGPPEGQHGPNHCAARHYRRTVYNHTELAGPCAGYCDCPNEASAARVASQLKQLGSRTTFSL